MYDKVARNLGKFVINPPPTHVPTPDESDYDRGFIRRYFLRKTNDPNAIIYEVESGIYAAMVENPFWKGTTIRWRLDGPLDPIIENGKVKDKGVVESNRASIGLGKMVLENLGVYLNNPKQFHISTLKTS